MKLNNEKQTLKLIIEERDKTVVAQKSIVDIEVQTQNIYQVPIKKNYNLDVNFMIIVSKIYINLGKHK